MSSPEVDKMLEELAAAGGLPRRASPPPEGHVHLASPQLWGLAAYDGGPMSEEERAEWERAAACSECFNRLADARRQLAAPGSADAFPLLPFERVWQAVRATLSQVVLDWVRAGLLVHAAGRATVSRRPVARSRDAFYQVSPEIWDFQQQFGAYGVALNIESRDARRKSWVLTATLSPAEGLVATLYSKGNCRFEKLLDSNGRVVFSDLGPDTYVLEIAMPGASPIATVQFLSKVIS